MGVRFSKRVGQVGAETRTLGLRDQERAGHSETGGRRTAKGPKPKADERREEKLERASCSV